MQTYDGGLKQKICMQNQLTRQTRYVSDYGETLIVRDICGVKALTDPCNEGLSVVVPNGRYAKLICYSFSGISNSGDRDHHVRVISSSNGICFASVKHPQLRITLQELTSGQKVDVLPAADAAPAYAVVLRPLPVFYGAATVKPEYAEVV